MICAYIIDMVEHKCAKCKKIFKKKDHYINHQNRINPCDSNIDANACMYCGIKYSTKGNLMRHIKSHCSVYNAMENEKKQIFDELLSLKLANEKITCEMNQLKSGLIKQHAIAGSNNGSNNGNINNSIVNSNNVNNITVVAFGKEKINSIDIKCITKAISAGFRSTIELTRNIHFNPNNPEFHNVYIPNMNNNCAMVFDGTNWNLTKRKEIIDDIYNDKKDFVEDNLEQFKNSLTQVKLNALNRWLAIEDDDDDIIIGIKKDIELLLYNNRNIPIETRKKLP